MDMESLMAQASELQTKIGAAQEKLSQMHVKGLSENGACIVDMTGKYDVVSLQIDDALMSRGPDGVSAAVLAALNDAKAKADVIIDRVMSDATAGMPMPE